jgi:orotate phosphoribosyltransferase-like protein
MSKLPLEIKRKAIALRKRGYSVKEIAEKLHIAKSTSSLWVREIKLNKKAQQRLK